MARLSADRQEAWREALERAVYGKAPHQQDEKILGDLDAFLARIPNETDFIYLQEEESNE